MLMCLLYLALKVAIDGADTMFSRRAFQGLMVLMANQFPLVVVLQCAGLASFRLCPLRLFALKKNNLENGTSLTGVSSKRDECWLKKILDPPIITHLI